LCCGHIDGVPTFQKNILPPSSGQNFGHEDEGSVFCLQGLTSTIPTYETTAQCCNQGDNNNMKYIIVTLSIAEK
jgi:hypothetical protein